MLTIYEVDYSVSPGGINSFEIYDELGSLVGDFDNLVDATTHCSNNGYDYIVKLLTNYTS